MGKWRAAIVCSGFSSFFCEKGQRHRSRGTREPCNQDELGLSPPEVRGHGQSHPTPPPAKPVTLNGWLLSAQPSTEEAEMEKTFGRELPADSDSDRVSHSQI